MTELLEAMSQQDAVEKLMGEVQRAMLVSEEETIDEIRAAYTQNMRTLIDDLVRVNAIFMSGEKPSYGEWKQLQLDVQSAKVITQNMSTFRQQLVDQLGQDLNDFYRQSYNMTSWVLDQTTPINIDPAYNLPPNQVLSTLFEEPWAGARFSDRVWAITDEWARNIQNELHSSILSGDSVATMASNIRDYTGVPSNEKLVSRPRASAQLYRATLIARTELIRAARMAQDDLYDQNADILDDKIWSATPDACDICLEKDGLTPDQILALGLDLDEHPNGRCSWMPKVKSWSELLDPAIARLKAMPGQIDPEVFGKFGNVSIEPYQEWSMRNLTPTEING